MIRSPAGALSRWKFIPALPVLILTMVAAADARAQVAAPAPGLPGSPAPGLPGAPAAPAAMPQLGTVPANVKSLNSAVDIKQHLPAIQGVIAAAIANLANDQNPAQQTRARNALINETMINGNANASATYLDAYAQILNQQLQPLANHPSPRVRLNAAIVTAEVARIANNIQLAPAALAFLNDKSDAIVLWGMKAARFIIPAQLRFAGTFNRQLADAIVPTVAKHSKGQVAGAIALEAYRALIIDIFNPAAAPPPAHLTTMAPYVLNLLQERLKLYVKGVAPSARAESFGTGFLTAPRVWPLLNQQQQLDAMQSMVNLVTLAGEQAEAANPGDRYELVQTIQRAASGISTVAPAAAPALQPATVLNPQNATPQEIDAAVKPIFEAVKALPQYKALKDPPPIQGNEPAPPPASAPTTGNILIPGTSTKPSGDAPPGITVPPGTTPTAPAPDGEPAPEAPNGKPPTAKPPQREPGAQPDDQTAPKPPGGTQSPRPTRPKAGDADKPGAAGGAGAGGATAPPTPTR